MQSANLVVENAHFARISDVSLALFRFKDRIRCMNGDNQGDKSFSSERSVDIEFEE